MYTLMKQKYVNMIDNQNNFNNLLIMLENMFDYENIEKIPTFNISDFNRYLLIFGKCGVININGEWFVTMLDFEGVKNKSGFFETGIYTSENGEISITHKFDNTHLYCRNNNLALGEFNIIKYADLLTENYKSLKTQMINTRLSKVMRALNDKQKLQIETVKQKIVDGELTVITSDISDSLLNDNTDIQILDFTDNDKTDKLQYLQTNYENLLKSFLNFYGIPMTSSNKLSQVNELEIKSPVYYANIYKNELFKERKKFFENFNKITGFDIKVKFSDCWAIPNNDFKEKEENENNLDRGEENADNTTIN